MYAGVVLGGLGSILGAFWGGLVIGIVQQMLELSYYRISSESGEFRRLPADHFSAPAREMAEAQRATSRIGPRPAGIFPCILGVAIAVIVLALVLKSDYYQLVLTQVLLWAVLSLAWNLLSGYSGISRSAMPCSGDWAPIPSRSASIP